MLSTYPDKSIVKLYAYFWTFAYLLIYFVFREAFPGKALIDTNIIQDIAEGYISRQNSTGYSATAAIYSLLPFWMSNAVTGLFNAYIVYSVLIYMRTFRSMVIILLILYPLVMLDMQAPSKETIVLAIGALLTIVAWQVRKDLVMFIWITAVYGLYGGFVRSYYLLILAVFFVFFLMLKTQPMLRWTYILAGVVVLISLPDAVFLALGSSRDVVNMHLYLGSPTSNVRTYFMNPYPADSALHFIGNFVYAFVMLNFPFVRFVTAKEILLFFNVVVYGWLMVQGIRFLRGPTRLLAILFAAHIVVQIIFEPDSGSYIRHFSSVLLYLMPAWLMYEENRVMFLSRSQA